MWSSGEVEVEWSERDKRNLHLNLIFFIKSHPAGEIEENARDS